MCPSYLATRDEKDSTRGRARVLQEMANGTLVSGGWTSPEVHETRWTSACPARPARPTARPAWTWPGTSPRCCYRAYRRRLRPRSHYALGWLPRWARLAGAAPRLVNALLRIRPLARAVLAAGGMDTRRAIPRSPRCRSAGRPRAAGGRALPARPQPPRPAAIGPAPGGAVGRLLHRRLRPRGAAGRRPGAGPGRLPGDRPRTFRRAAA